jgi:hypothetical protein
MNYSFIKELTANNSSVTIPKGSQNIKIKNSNASKNSINILSYSYDETTGTDTLQSTTLLEAGDSMSIGAPFMTFGKFVVVSKTADDFAYINWI